MAAVTTPFGLGGDVGVHDSFAGFSGMAPGAAMASKLGLLGHRWDLENNADELARQQMQWAHHCNVAVAAAETREAASQQAFAALQASLAPLPDEFQLGHLSRLVELSRAMTDAKESLSSEHRICRKGLEELQQAAEWRRRVARCRLEREKESLRTEQVRNEREARERERLEHVRLERERERAHARRVALEVERERLRGELAIERERRRGPRACSEVQTDALTELHVAASGKADIGSDASYSDEAFDSEGSDEAYEDDFDDSGDDSEEKPVSHSSSSSPAQRSSSSSPPARSAQDNLSRLSSPISSLASSPVARQTLVVGAVVRKLDDDMSEDISSEILSASVVQTVPNASQAAPRRGLGASISESIASEVRSDMSESIPSISG